RRFLRARARRLPGPRRRGAAAHPGGRRQPAARGDPGRAGRHPGRLGGLTMLYPWQHAAWQALLEQRERLPHALLLTGEPGIGKPAFGRPLAQSLLCEAASATKPCGGCDACRWFLAGNHPDFRELAPASEDEGDEEESAKAKKKPSAWITIDQVRELND